MPDTGITGDLFLFSPEAETRPAAICTAKAEALLVEKAAAGDEDAFAELYKMFAPMVHGIVLARVPRDEADDVTQEVFIAAYKNLCSLRDKNVVGPWLAKIARNRAVGLIRGKRPNVELTDENGGARDSESKANEILNVILKMPTAYKETLVLRLVEGMTGPEIAEQTGMAPDSVRVNLHRGMKLLRQRLGLEMKR